MNTISHSFPIKYIFLLAIMASGLLVFLNLLLHWLYLASSSLNIRGAHGSGFRPLVFSTLTHLVTSSSHVTLNAIYILLAPRMDPSPEFNLCVHLYSTSPLGIS